MEAYVMDDGPWRGDGPRGDAPLDDLDGRRGRRGRMHHNLSWWRDGSRDGDFDDLANLLVNSPDGHGLRDRVDTSEALDRAELVVGGDGARLRACNGTDVPLDGWTRVEADDGVDLRLRLHVTARG